MVGFTSEELQKYLNRYINLIDKTKQKLYNDY
jgi:hypothetical protein